MGPNDAEAFGTAGSAYGTVDGARGGGARIIGITGQGRAGDPRAARRRAPVSITPPGIPVSPRLAACRATGRSGFGAAPAFRMRVCIAGGASRRLPRGARAGRRPSRRAPRSRKRGLEPLLGLYGTTAAPTR